MLLRFFHWREAHFTATVATLSVCLLTLASAQAQDDQCWLQRQQALAGFRAGANAETIVLLNRCLNQTGLNDSTKVDIYALLSRAHLAIKDSAAAVRDILSLLDLAPKFAPDVVGYTPGYRRFFQAVKKYWEDRQPPTTQPAAEQSGKEGEIAKRPRSKKWLWIGGGAVATAGIVYAVLPRKPNDGKVFLPDPPGRPN
jgi:hypothetical protein